MITVLTWLWRQPLSRTNFTAAHVNVWAAMVRRHLAMPHELACVTDMPAGIDPGIRIIAPPGDFEGLQTPTWHGRRPSCYRRLSMFRRDASAIFGDRFVCMDLDVVVGGPLAPLFDRNDDLVIFKGTAEGRPYNGSMMLLRAGCRPQVFEDFSEAGAIEAGKRFVGSDQAWLAYRLGAGEATWDKTDDVFWWGPEYRRVRKRVSPRLLFFPGKQKPWDLIKLRIDPFINANYRANLREAA